MSKCQVKLVKSFDDLIPIESNENANSPQDIADRGNFLDNVDRNLLYVDALKGFEDSFAWKIENGGEETEESPNFQLTSPEVLGDSLNVQLASLSSQVPLPIESLPSLFFDEVLMISKQISPRDSNKPQEICRKLNCQTKNTPLDTDNSPSFIPSPLEINETGSVCLMMEPLDDNKVLVFSTLQCQEGSVFATQEVLSVVDANLQLVHEKIVEKRSFGGKTQVSFKVPTITVKFLLDLCRKFRFKSSKIATDFV
jgi:hypothetical protein